jgi:hypothetical protein
MTRLSGIFIFLIVSAMPLLLAGEGGRAKPDLAGLRGVDVDAIVRDGCSRGTSDYASLIREADEQIAAIRARKDYAEADLDLLTSPWIRTKVSLQLLRDGWQLPPLKPTVRVRRNGICDCAETTVFKGDVGRALALLREIGLKDTATGKSWSKTWGCMERIPTVLGQAPSGDIVLRVDLVLGTDLLFDSLYKQLYNVRDIERYSERRLGQGEWLIVQDLIRDDSEGAPPRGPEHPKRPPKPYHPVKELLKLQVIHDNRDGTFTLANAMCTHGQELKATSEGVLFLKDLLKLDLEKISLEHTIKSRKKWISLFQKAVLAPVATERAK